MSQSSQPARCGFACVLLVVFGNAFAIADDTEIFRLPERFAVIQQKLSLRQRALRVGKLKEAEVLAAEAVRVMPGVPETLLFLASTQAELGKEDDAFGNLTKAVDAGLSNIETLNQPVFNVLKRQDGWEALVAKARTAKPDPAALWRRPAIAADVKNGVATVAATNTRWIPQGNVLLSLFKLPDENKTQQIVRGEGKVGEKLRRWRTEGTAAGNYGDFYDNHDRDHSNLKVKNFPQLTRIEYSAAARKANLDWGAQVNMLFNGVVIGNSSTSLTTKRIWRSQTRLIETNQPTMSQLYNQYTNNHLYFYPEHHDYDPGHNGKRGKRGYGDVFFANVPYVIVSQGSSGSDRVFMHAVAATLAAFQPEVKKKLVKTKLLMPTVQMIFRRCNKNVANDQAYLTGAAHPPVFNGKNIDAMKMIEMAHSMTTEHLPPVPRFRVVRESKPVGVEGVERIFDTLGAVARIHRTKDYVRKMQLDASGSLTANGEKLTYHWKVLLGDADRIKIRPLDDTGAKVELEIPWHDRFPIAPGSAMETNRVDIACFVSTEQWFSPPAFVSTYFPDNDKRVYKNGKLISQTKTANYADPFLTQPQGN